MNTEDLFHAPLPDDSDHEKELASLTRLVPNYADEFLSSLKKTFAKENNPLEKPMHAIAEETTTMRNHVYGTLVGLFNFLRSNGVNPNSNIKMKFEEIVDNIRFNPYYHPNLSLMLERFSQIHKHVQSPKYNEEEFATDSLLFLRTMYPLGTNMLNPQLEEDKPISINAENTDVRVSSIDEPIYNLEPYEDDRSKISAIDAMGGSYILESQSSAILGRPLILNDIFGLKLAKPVAIHPEVRLSSRYISRAGCMVIRRGGKLYFFDRGSRNRVLLAIVESERKYLTEYIGSARVETDPVTNCMSFSFGESKEVEDSESDEGGDRKDDAHDSDPDTPNSDAV